MKLDQVCSLCINRFFEAVPEEHRKSGSTVISLPTRGTKQAAAYDFVSPITTCIMPMQSAMIWTDVRACCQVDEVLLLNVRSSMGKQPIMLANTQGWVDSDYYDNPDNGGNIGIRLLNLGNTPYEIHEGDKIAQGMFVKYLQSSNGDSDVVRQGGFGSTGK